MIEQGLFKQNFYGKSGFVWWIGQIPDEKTWRTNIPGVRTATNEDHDGFGWRYKVRIMGYHPASKEIEDEQLPWASVVFPVTAGSGAGGASQSPNLRQGNFVYGFFLDGDEGQQPVIMGVIDNNNFTSIERNIPDIPFVPFSGYTPEDNISTYSLSTTQEKGAGTQRKSPGETVNPNNTEVLEGSNYEGRKDGASKEQYENGKIENPIPSPGECEKMPLGKIQKEIQNVIKDVQRYKKSLTDWETRISTKVDDVDAAIEKAMKKASKEISGGVKFMIKEVQKNVVKKVNDTLKDTYYNLFPSERPGLKKKIETANDLIACLFKRIIGNLFGMVSDFLSQAIDRFINTPLCAVENFVGALLGKITGLISSGVDAILGPLRALTGLGSIAGDIMDVVTDVLSFLSCEDPPACNEIKEWSTWNGAQPSLTLNIDAIMQKARGFAGDMKDAVDPDNFNFNTDFSDVFQDTCNVGPVFCGPPTIEFFGGGGGSVKANAIVSAATTILGVDLISGGVNYKTAPFVRFVDGCGKGKGAVGRAVIGPVTVDPTTGNSIPNPNGDQVGVVKVVMDQGGIDYMSNVDGSQGGDGRTWANANETTIKRTDGTYDTPYKPGTVVDVSVGDEITAPGGVKSIVEEDTTITCEYPPDIIPTLSNQSIGGYPSLNVGDYPVVLEIESINIGKRGVNYDDSKDRIIIEPNNGAKIELKCDGVGGISAANVINPGIGFVEKPNIYIQSDTGYNAKLNPVFKVNRIGDVEAVDAPLADQIIQVVDCVGHV